MAKRRRTRKRINPPPRPARKPPGHNALAVGLLTVGGFVLVSSLVKGGNR